MRDDAKQCEHCCDLEKRFEVAAHDPHRSLLSIYDSMNERYRQKKLLIYMSDHPFSNLLEEVNSEKHYTCEAYLKCSGCGRIYHLGICIRGTPVYEVLDEEPDKAEFMYRCLRDGKQFYEQ